MKIKITGRIFVFCLLIAAACGQAAAQSIYREGVPEIGLNEDDGRVSAIKQLPQFSVLIKELSPAVVNISVETGDEAEAAEPKDANPFSRKEPGQQPGRSLGSGFIITEDGYIVTNNHVIDRSEKVIVRMLDDKADYTAKVVGKDLKTDLALLKIEPKGRLKTVFLGDSDDVEVGEWVLAIGNQFQLGQTVTAGIVSAKSRRVPTKASGPYDAFIQTDASINPGSSGGPLFNVKGQVIGINTAIFSPGRSPFFGSGTGFNIGIGFAIPINLVKTIIPQLKEHGKVTRGMLGVIIQRIDNDVAEALGLKSADGALVADIMPDSPASKAGFRRRDVIVKFEDSPIREHEDLPLLVANTPIGRKVSVEVLRDGQKKVLSVVVEELKEKAITKEDPSLKTNSIGLAVQEMTEEIARSLNLTKAEGVIVNNVLPNSPSDKAGIARGDIIEEINKQPVPNVEAFNKIVEQLPKDTPILVLLRRAEGTRFLTLKIK